jgi:hypothetical protein
MNEVDNPVGAAVIRVGTLIAAWLAALKAADIQVWVAIVGGLSVVVYTWMQAYVLWRDKMRKPPVVEDKS